MKKLTKKVFPFTSLHTKTFIAWSNYIKNLDLNIKSLEDYLQYFNPDYGIHNDIIRLSNNEKISPLNKLTDDDVWVSYEIYESGDTLTDNTKTTLIDSNGVLLKELNITEEPIEKGYLFRPNYLRYREGYYNNKDYNTYVCYSTIYPQEGVLKLSKQGFNDLKLVPFSPATTIFSNRWTHRGIENKDNIERFNPQSYKTVARKEPAFYLPYSLGNNLSFKYYDNALSLVGRNIFFSIETSPGRYYLCNEKDREWNDFANSWVRSAAFWEREDKDAVLKITDNGGKIWTGGYPIIHRLYIEDKKDNSTHFESFITDDVFSTKETNIANHYTMQYTIKVNDMDKEEQANTKWGSLGVKVLII